MGRLIILVGLILCLLYGQDLMGMIQSGAMSGMPTMPSFGGSMADIAGGVSRIGARTSEAAASGGSALRPGAGADLSAGERVFRGVVARWMEHRLIGNMSLWGLLVSWVLLAGAASFAELAFVGRVLSMTGVRVMNAWLGLLSGTLLLVAALSGANPWTALPMELFAAPALALVGSAAMARVVDENAPVWNTTITGLAVAIVSMVGCTLIGVVDPLGMGG